MRGTRESRPCRQDSKRRCETQTEGDRRRRLVRRADMPKFFFHLTNGETVRDDRGTRCTTVEEAKAFAQGVAAELGRNRLLEEIQHLAFYFTGETGMEIL